MSFTRTFILLVFIACSFHCMAQPRDVRMKPTAPAEKNAPAFLKIRGNLLYDFSYRSYVDTPFVQNNALQHLTQASFDLVIQDKYPLKILLTNRSGNSPYFRNTTDINLRFDRPQLLNNIKQRLKSKIPDLSAEAELAKIESVYAEKSQKIQELQTWLSDPARVQELVSEKEKDLGAKFSPSEADTLPINGNRGAPFERTADEFEAKSRELATLREELRLCGDKISALKKNVQDSFNSLNKQVNGLRHASEVFDFMRKNGIGKNELTKAERLMLSVNRVGIGRAWVDYSELTVKNISLVGVDLELNPGPVYVAFAAGRLNYRFRDFILKNNALPDQSLYLARIGAGKKERNNFILTFYDGKRELLNPTFNNSGAPQRVLGVSAEVKLALNENNYIVAEVAKSSFRNSANESLPSNELMRRALNLKIHDNEAYSMKFSGEIPATDTKFTGYYRKIGKNFQSFNLYPTYVGQDAWMAKINQQFWKKRIAVEAAVRKNDFISPIAVPSFESTTIFKSVLLTLKIPKFPFVSVGYYPSSQFSLINNNLLTENRYNTLNAVVSHSYRLRNVGMNTSAVFTRFYNDGNETDFIYFNATSYTLNHGMFLSQWLLQSTATWTEQRDLHLFAVEQLLGYRFKNNVSVSGSMKYHRLNKSETFIGGTGTLSIYIKKLGTFQINYGKVYLPGYNRTFVPADTGELSFCRAF